MLDKPSDGNDLDSPTDKLGESPGESPGEAAYNRSVAQAREAEIARLPEIVVQAKSIPWWVWGLVGGLAVMMFLNKGSRR